MIGLAASFVFDNPLGKALLGGFGFVALFASWLFLHDAKVKSEVKKDINRAAEVQGEKAKEARRGADVDDPVARLRRRSCGNC